MTPKQCSRLLHAYVGLTIIAAFAFIGVRLARAGFGAAFGSRPAAVAVFAVLILIAERSPLAIIGPNEASVTASLTFVFSLMQIAPPATGLTIMATVSILVEVARRRPLARLLFNAAQVSIALLAGYEAFDLLGDPQRLLHSPPSIPWLLGSTLAGATVFAINVIMTSVAIGLANEVSPIGVARSMVDVSTAMDAVLITVSPVFVVVAVHGLILLPMLAMAVWAIYKSSQMAMSHRHEATHDALTGLANRRHFTDLAAQALKVAKEDGVLAILHLDLDGFKQINDQLGHAVGDMVLTEVSRRLETSCGPGNVAARLGGDEFAIILSGPGAAERAHQTAAEVLTELRRPMLVEGVPLQISGSIGAALYPDHGTTLSELLHHADVAMYRAKTDHSGTHVYDSGVDRHGPTKLGLMADLTRAIDSEELFLVYQPQVNLRTGTVDGVEALLRWNHPLRGLVPPTAFITTAEHTELIGPLTNYVLHHALAQTALWRQSGLELRTAINVSARNLHDDAFVGVVEQALVEHGVAAEWLEIEITENTVLSDPERSAAMLHRLRDLGVRIAIDDFGTGYSSLASLRHLPIDRIKIDRSFVANMAASQEDATIVRSIIELARNLGIKTVAEGVERADGLGLLCDMDCDTAQGFLFARPAAPEMIESILRSSWRAGSLFGPTSLVTTSN